MFYNVNLGAVEDLTGRGLEDLRAGIFARHCTRWRPFWMVRFSGKS